MQGGARKRSHTRSADGTCTFITLESYVQQLHKYPLVKYCNFFHILYCPAKTVENLSFDVPNTCIERRLAIAKFDKST